VFLAASFGLPLREDQLALFQHHAGRTVAPSVLFRERSAGNRAPRAANPVEPAAGT
jgi:hypothetical protein